MGLKNCKIGTCVLAKSIVFFVVSLLLLPNLKAEKADLSASLEAEHADNQEEFNAGTVIVEHITNAYEWHIFQWKNKHVTIPLPVILIADGKLHVFSSSHFHHGEKAYNGFAICHEDGLKKGRIVRVDENENRIANASVIDISITKNVLSLFIGFAIILVIFISMANGYRKRGVAAPKGIARAIEPLILFVRDDIARPAIGHRNERYLPFLLTVFFFIFLNNLLGLVPFFPGGANVTGNISVTLVLALFTFVIVNVSANRTYWKHIVNTPGVPWWLKIPLPIMPIVEAIGVITKPIVLTIRLFANISAGHIICLGFISLIFIFGKMNPMAGYGVSVFSVFFYIFMSVLELLVAFIQAFVFTLLSAIYIGMAIEEHHHETAEIAEVN
ncbi:MAG: F0F1 ATP synthase subunit A [Lentimicrobiaceae bacterium]|nr:F0F1 ATP synthase subunit A [Lentimicrobiaceae bacterium]